MVLRLQAVPRVTREPDVLKALLGVHVLVVDHDPDARQLLESVLSYGGAFVTPAASADEALMYLGKGPVNVVVAELELPEKDGYWLLKAIGDRARVVALATGPADVMDRALEAGFDAHIRKPVDPWELCRIVGRLARKP